MRENERSAVDVPGIWTPYARALADYTEGVSLPLGTTAEERASGVATFDPTGGVTNITPRRNFTPQRGRSDRP